MGDERAPRGWRARHVSAIRLSRRPSVSGPAPRAVGRARRAQVPRLMEQPAAVVARALRDPAGPPPDWSETDIAAVVAAASRHRVFLLLGWLLRDAGELDEWP